MIKIFTGKGRKGNGRKLIRCQDNDHPEKRQKTVSEKSREKKVKKTQEWKAKEVEEKGE